ncbi:MAG: tryptophan 7-halogenase [Symploca sp. SIO3C6]|nr:tryptophan 7-halogenase [Symploca sp. SIO3C6]
MKIAVIGGGTAGHMAAAHISKHFPQFELYHIYDSKIPSIGVGEGTLPGFPVWLTEITGLDYPDLKELCQITIKYGNCFENWGNKHQQFMHHFYPIGDTYAYHISADQIVKILQDYISATHIDKKVIDLKSDGITVDIAFEDNTSLQADLAIDARGFPKSLNDNHLKLSLIPTNAALIRQCPGYDKRLVNVKMGEQLFQYESATRAVARPHGWIFVIPLTHRTSYGYIYNSSINSAEEIATDFDEFLSLEGVEFTGKQKKLNFPNFTQQTLFDGAIFKLGNAASFLEPLEATAIAVTLQQMYSFSHWPLGYLSQQKQRGKLKESNVQVLNRYLLKNIYKLSLFVGWHYAMGSAFDTEFWRFAKSNFQQGIQKLEDQEIIAEFDDYLQTGFDFDDPINQHEIFVNKTTQFQAIDDETNLAESNIKTFSQFPPQSFAEVGYGMGYFPEI